MIIESIDTRMHFIYLLFCCGIFYFSNIFELNEKRWHFLIYVAYYNKLYFMNGWMAVIFILKSKFTYNLFKYFKIFDFQVMLT